MSSCSYPFSACNSKNMHVTTGGVVSKYCTRHVMKLSSQRKRPRMLSYEKSVATTEKARLRMTVHRVTKKQLIEDVTDHEVKRIAEQMAKLKIKSRAYVIIDDVIETLDPEEITVSGSVQPIDFTNIKDPVKRTMQEIADESKYLFANITNALRIVFPGCTHHKLKVIKSLATDLPQLTHTDLDVSLINKRVFSLESFHYSVIIALQADTHLLNGTERMRQNIPINSMIMFRGDFLTLVGVTAQKTLAFSFLLRQISIPYPSPYIS